MNRNEEQRAKFTDDLIFSLVMRDEEICRGLLERILPDEEFGEIKLASKEHPLFSDEPLTVEQQKSLKFDLDAHGVRFDAFAKNDKMWAEIEMQTYTDKYLGKRARYYQANMDMDFLEAGRSYKDLKRAYIIFICTYDHVGTGDAVYFFQTYEPNKQLSFDDEVYKIVLNTKCDPDKVPEKLKPLFAYINDAECIQDEFIENLDNRVQKFNTPDWRKKQMTLAHMLDNAEAKGMKLVNELNKKLLESNRIEDLKKAMEDEAYQKQLLLEFNLLDD